MAEADQRLVGITPAMREGSGMVEFHKRFPTRYHDVGIAEQHAVTFAAGLACEGLKPVVAIYSTFLQRGYDQLIHDVAIQNLPVVFALDRAGLVGADGATHAGAYDIAYTRCIPNMSVLTPADENECRQALTTAFRQYAPGHRALPARRRRRRRHRADADRVALGPRRGPPPGQRASRSWPSAPCSTRRWPRPRRWTPRWPTCASSSRSTRRWSSSWRARHDAIVTVEDGCRLGGAGSAVGECLAAAGVAVPLLSLGLPDEFIEHGDPAKLMSMCGLDAAGIEQSIRQRFGSRPALVRPAVNS